MKIFLYPPTLLGSQKLEDIERWLEMVCQVHGKALKQLFILDVSAEDIQKLHQRYFNKSEETDVITLDYSNADEVIATLYCCSSFIQQHLQAYGQKTLEEALLRIILHGVLHVLGYKDHTSHQQQHMTKIETLWLKKL